MNQKEIRIIKGFLGLSSSEREKVIKEINRYRNLNYSERLDFEKMIKNSSVGPKYTICDCCGR